MGSWFDAKKDGACTHCGAPVTAGDRMYAKRKGVWLCEGCGTLAEALPPEGGPIEQGVRNDLDKLPEEADKTSLAKAMVAIARQLDQGDVPPREYTQYTKELRLNFMQLRDLFPPAEEDDDPTTAARNQRERRYREIGGI